MAVLKHKMCGDNLELTGEETEGKQYRILFEVNENDSRE